MAELLLLNHGNPWTEAMILLSVDWDFCVPENPAWDIQHAENLLHLKFIWMHRYCLRNQMTTTGEEQDFWRIIHSHFKFHGRARRMVSDSHAFGYEAAAGCDGVVLFDSHHDCWPVAQRKRVHCHDWLRIWLEEVPTRWAIWVWPEHAKRIGAPELPDDMVDRVTAVRWEDFKADNSLVPRHEAIGAVHVCRSGCWTPPWLDKAFIDFFSEGNTPEDFEKCQDGDWDPLAERWTLAEEEAASEFQRQVEEMTKKFRTSESPAL